MEGMWSYLEDEMKINNEWAYELVQMSPNDLPSVVKPVTVAVVDSGFDTNHPLFGEIEFTGWNARDCTSDIDANTVINEEGDVENHGTHVAGIIVQFAGKDSLNKMKGYKFGTYSKVYNMINALEAIAQDPDIAIVNISCRVDNASYFGLKGILEAGKIVVVAAGNDCGTIGLRMGENKDDKIVKLAQRYQTLLFVGALNKTGRLANWSAIPGEDASSYYVAAPGVRIESSVPLRNKYNVIKQQSGTSMASPLVTGLIVKLLAQFPSVSARKVVRAVVNNTKKCDNINSCRSIISYQSTYNKLCEYTLLQEFETLTADEILHRTPRYMENGVFDLNKARKKLSRVVQTKESKIEELQKLFPHVDYKTVHETWENMWKDTHVNNVTVEEVGKKATEYLERQEQKGQKKRIKSILDTLTKKFSELSRTELKEIVVNAKKEDGRFSRTEAKRLAKNLETKKKKKLARQERMEHVSERAGGYIPYPPSYRDIPYQQPYYGSNGMPYPQQPYQQQQYYGNNGMPYPQQLYQQQQYYGSNGRPYQQQFGGNRASNHSQFWN